MALIRILHILHTMNRGGTENAIMNYYRHIDREKVQFDFLLTDPEKCAFEDEIIKLGGMVHRIPKLTMTNPIPYIKEVNNFFKAHHEYQIVHSHTSSKSVFPLYIAKKHNIPVRICHSHSSKSENGVKGAIRDILKIGLKHVATHYFACGDKAAEWLYGKPFVQKQTITIIRNVIEGHKFALNINKRIQIRHLLHIDDSTFILGHVARFNDAKNYLFTIDVFYEFKVLHPDSKLLLVGDGELRAQITDKVNSLGLGNDVIFAGVVPNVYDYEQAIDLFLLPSLYEGLPLSIIEAQISGLKCFTSANRVSEESSVTNLVSYLPLERGAKYWADEIYKAKDYNRYDRLDEIKKAGYDARTSAYELENIYTDLYKNTI